MRRWPLLVIALVSSSCIDPVHSDAVDALGPEAAGVREGPEHRPGQPCLTCHGGDGPGPTWVAAGTVYEVRGDLSKPLVRGIVKLEDSAGKSIETSTNKVGNWWIEERRFTPVFPLYATVYDESRANQAQMVTRIGRNAGCGYCHQGAVATSNRMPAVYLKSKP